MERAAKRAWEREREETAEGMRCAKKSNFEAVRARMRLASSSRRYI
jgi:hypothetical protein